MPDERLSRHILGAFRAGLPGDQFVTVLRALVEAADVEERHVGSAIPAFHFEARLCLLWI